MARQKCYLSYSRKIAKSLRTNMLSYGLLLFVVSGIAAGAQPAVLDPPPGTVPDAWQYATVLAAEVRASSAPEFLPTRHPQAAWYPDAGLGLFVHWGIHSVAGVQPSWAMIKDYPAGGEPAMHPTERYYALAEKFNPRNYDPDIWMAAAAKAGFTYAVLTAKHHDGYALWPTKFGDMGTRQYMNGRDLLKPYIDACRNHGLRVGLYFSPRDWHYPGYPVDDAGFDYNKRGQYPPIEDPGKNCRDFEAFYAYTIGQLHELLTSYGQIDVLWFDGMGWHGIEDTYANQTVAWIRSLQPGIVINDRWGGTGDFTTPEWEFPKGPPQGWWENCIAWNGHWGYNPDGAFQSSEWAMDRLVRAREWGGNFLLNVGPAPDGSMPEGFYERCSELAEWMESNRDAVLGAFPSPGEERCNMRLTARGKSWYIHIPPGHEGNIELRLVRPPDSLSLLHSGEAIPFVPDENGTVRFAVPTDKRVALDTVAVARWDLQRWEDDIQRIEKTVSNAPANPVLFAGSSSILGWNLPQYFPDLPVLNHGFGGSEYFDALCYADRIIVPFRPRAVVLYDGDNDIANGKTAEWVSADMKALVRSIHHAYPGTPIVVLSIKTSLSRWAKHEEMEKANGLMAEFARNTSGVTFLDMNSPLLAPDGKPDDRYFREDHLHLNPEGYAVWTGILRPVLDGILNENRSAD